MKNKKKTTPKSGKPNLAKNNQENNKVSDYDTKSPKPLKNLHQSNYINFIFTF